jgi:hypothetical protein
MVGCEASTEGIVTAGCTVGNLSFTNQQSMQSTQQVYMLEQKLNETDLFVQEKRLFFAQTVAGVSSRSSPLC